MDSGDDPRRAPRVAREPVALHPSPVAERRVAVVATVVVLGLVLAVLKPWAPAEVPPGPSPPASAATRASVAIVAPVPSPTERRRDERDPGGQCYFGDAWRIFTIEVDRETTLRSWRPVDPIPATGPQDVAIRFVRVVADRVVALGFCAVSHPIGRPVASVEAWAAPASAAPVTVDLVPLAAWTPATTDQGRVFQPPTGFGAAAGAWAPGRYVFVVRHGPAPTDAEWYGVEIVASGREPVAPGSPVASPTAPGNGATASPGPIAP